MLTNSREQVVIFFYTKHTHILSASSKPRKLLRQTLYSQDALHYIHMAITKVHTSLSVTEPITLHKVAHLSVSSVVAGAWVALSEAIRIKLKNYGIHTHRIN